MIEQIEITLQPKSRGYIGESTRCEIAYAEKAGKKINYMEES